MGQRDDRTDGPPTIVYQLRALYMELDDLRTQLEQAQVIIDKLPKDRDGIPCLPGYERCHDDFDKIGVVRIHDWEDRDATVEFDLTGSGDWQYRPVEECHARD